jgi:2-haloacid dehalogenase
MLFSSQLLGVSKPTLAVYHKAMTLVGIEDPGQAVMVAAHAYDLRAARQAGLKTVYIQRWTDDLDETDQQRLHRENDGNVLANFDGLADTIKRL